MEKVRAYWFRELLRVRFKNDRKAFLDATKLSKGRITHLVSDGFGDVAAKRMLNRLADSGHELPMDYFDRPIPPEESSVVQIDASSAGTAKATLEEAIRLVGEALSRLPDKAARDFALQVIGNYASSPTDAAMNYAKEILGGGIPEAEKPRQAGGQG